jgi:hypothetical protein
MTVEVGVLLSCGAAWAWRRYGGGGQIAAWQIDALFGGIVIMTVGMVWLVRAISRRDLWWKVTSAIALFYVAASVIGHYFIG